MATKSQRPKGRDAILSSLNMAIDTLNLAKELSSITPAKAVFGSVAILLTMIKVRDVLSSSAMGCSGLTRSQDTMANEADYVDVGLFCADICRALNRGMNGKKLDDLSQSVCDAINQLTT